MKRILLFITASILSFSTLAQVKHDCLAIPFEDQEIQKEYNDFIKNHHCNKIDYKVKYLNGQTVYEINGKTFEIVNDKYREITPTDEIEDEIIILNDEQND